MEHATPTNTVNAIAKAKALIEAHRYIMQFRNKVVVIKVGGSVQEDQDKLRALLTDISFLSAVGVKPIIVHGGGKDITKAMAASGLEPRFVQGRRFTDEKTLAIAERVLVEQINAGLVQHLNDAGSKAMGLHSMGTCVLFAEKFWVNDGQTGEPVDLGCVGHVTDVNTDVLSASIAQGHVPVLAPVALADHNNNGTYTKFNVNADTAAAHVAAAMGAAKLVMCSDTHGIRTDPDDPDSYASTLTRSEINELIEQGVIGEGMLPKVDACLIALAGGVPQAHIIDGQIQHSILQEIYTDEGVGTQIVLGEPIEATV